MDMIIKKIAMGMFEADYNVANSASVIKKLGNYMDVAGLSVRQP